MTNLCGPNEVSNKPWSVRPCPCQGSAVVCLLHWVTKYVKAQMIIACISLDDAQSQGRNFKTTNLICQLLCVTIHIPMDWQARYPRRGSVFLQFGIGWGAKHPLAPDQTRHTQGLDSILANRPALPAPTKTYTHPLGKDARPRHKTDNPLGKNA